MNGEKGFDTAVGITRAIMTIIGAWPQEKLKTNIANRIIIILHICMIFFSVTLPQTRRAINVRKNLSFLLEVMAGIIMESIGILKLMGFWYNHKGLKKLIVRVADDWKSSNDKDREVMTKYANLSRSIAILCTILFSGNVILQLLRVIAVYRINVRLIENGTLERPTFLKTDYDFDIQKSPLYEIIFVGQFLACSSLALSYIAYDGFFVFSILHFSGQFYNLQSKIECIMQEKRTKQFLFIDLLKDVVHRHQDLCRYTDIIEENFNKIFLAQMLATIILLCFQAYELATIVAERADDMIPNIIFSICFVTSNTFSVFLYCFAAEILRTETVTLFHSLFNFEWYELPPNESKLIIVIMILTKSPVEITVGKFVAFSLEYFTTVIKTSAGYLSVLLAMRDRL